MARPPAPSRSRSIDAARLDQVLVARGFYDTRSKARDAILRGGIAVGGAKMTKPGETVALDAPIAIDDPAHRYVSRAALKLAHALAHFAIPVEGRIGLDIGASTGGFTQVLLERGAAKVYAVDVGRGQMAENVSTDERVVLLEGKNARSLTRLDVPEEPGVIVCDVSFISLTLALPAALGLAGPEAALVALVKPQFEAGPAAVGRTGVVRDAAIHDETTRRIRAWLEARGGWHVLGIEPSPIEGADGNREFLIAAERKP